MPVTSYCNQRLQNQRDLYQFLAQCQVDCRENCAQLVSLSFPIATVDPLVIFDQLAEPNQLNGYFEKQLKAKHFDANPQQIAIAAIDASVQFQVNGLQVDDPTKPNQRFTQAKQFIQSTLSQTIIAGDLTNPFSGATFFCSFSFQNYPANPDLSDFPAVTIFLPKWQIATCDRASTVVSNVWIDQETDLAKMVNHIWETLQKIQTIPHHDSRYTQQPIELLQKIDVVPTASFKQSVDAALQAIQTHQFDKIVLAHAVDVIAPEPFDQTACLHRLRQLYPDCYIFLVSNTTGRSFLGASPERLICLQDRHLITDALAGSAPRGHTPREDMLLATSLLNSDKDNIEHQIVVDFITRKLTRLGLNPKLSPLRLLQLSNIQHLHTPIRATLANSVHVLDVVAELHPTPAVAGLPQAIACAELDRREPFERSLYAAPIGWVNYRGDGEFIVGIRSALIMGDRARLFAGAGIVAGSDPERELAEVQLKLQALLTALV